MIHASLRGRGFRLGQVNYVVAHDQPDDACVRCFRKEGNVVTVVRLPLVFVIEQLVDEVALALPA